MTESTHTRARAGLAVRTSTTTCGRAAEETGPPQEGDRPASGRRQARLGKATGPPREGDRPASGRRQARLGNSPNLVHCVVSRQMLPWHVHYDLPDGRS
jgi:hypothetical protein